MVGARRKRTAWTGEVQRARSDTFRLGLSDFAHLGLDPACSDTDSYLSALSLVHTSTLYLVMVHHAGGNLDHTWHVPLRTLGGWVVGGGDAGVRSLSQSSTTPHQ